MRRIIIILGIAALVIGGLVTGIFIADPRLQRTARAATTQTVGAADARSAAGMTARRNAVWKFWNKGLDAEPKTTDEKTAAVLGSLISPRADIGRRNIAMSKFLRKSTDYFSAGQIEAISDAMGKEYTPELGQMVRSVIDADLDSSDLMRQVLADDRRVNLYMAGKDIPLETMPDGTTP